MMTTITKIERMGYMTPKVKKRRVLIATNELGEIRAGGVATYIENLETMLEEEFEVGILFIENIWWYEKANDPIWFTKWLAKQHKAYNGEFMAYSDGFLYKIKQLVKFINSYDVVIHSSWGCVKPLQFIKKYCSQKVRNIGIVHSNLIAESVFNDTRIDMDGQQVKWLALMDKVIVISVSELATYIETNMDIANDNVSIIYNPYIPKMKGSKNKYLNERNKKNMGYIGRFVPRKKPEHLVFAQEKIRRLHGIDTHFIGAGVSHPNGYWNHLQNTYSNVTLHKWSSDKKAIEENFWQQVNLVGITGVYEPFGYTCLEAIDRMTPILVQDIGGPREIVSGFENCCFMYETSTNEKQSVNNMEDVIMRYLNTPIDELHNKAKKLRQVMKRFDKTK